MAGNTADAAAETVPNKPVDANPKPVIVTPVDANNPSNPIIISIDNDFADDTNSNPDLYSYSPYDDDYNAYNDAP